MQVKELMYYNLYKKAFEDAGYSSRDCGRGHWQVWNKEHFYNWYPNSKKQSLYDARTKENLSGVTWSDFKKKLNDVEKRRINTGVKNILLRKNGNICYLCNKPYSFDQLSVDHVKPLSRGGTNDIGNMKLACIECNRDKSNYEIVIVKENIFMKIIRWVFFL